MDKKKVLIIVNPKSGRMVASRLAFNYGNQFRNTDYEAFIRMTTGRHDATDVAKRLADKFDVIMCRGGDGTLSETISGVLESGINVPVGCIPGGTTNDFAKSNGIPLKSQEAINLVLNSEPVPQDVGKFGDDRYFIYTASFGLFTKASYATPQSIKNKFGYISYLVGGATELTNIKKIHAKVTCDGVEYEDDYIFGSVTNSLAVGGGVFRFSKDMMSFDDGLFELVLVKMPKDIKELAKLALCLKSGEYDKDYFTIVKGKEFSFDFGDKEIPWTLDGEFGGDTEKVDIKCLEHAIRLYKPLED